MAKPILPMALPGGELLPHMSARRRHEIADVVFEMVGGVDRLAHEAGKNSDAYWEFIKSVWAKGLPKLNTTEHHASDSVEALLDKLDQAERAVTIDGTATLLDG